MCGGNSAWDDGVKTLKTAYRTEMFDFTHLSVRPRELMETKRLQYHACFFVYMDKSKNIRKLTLPLNELIFTTIMNASDSVHIMKILQGKTNATLDELLKEEELTQILPKILAKDCLIHFENSNIGPDIALKRILRNDKDKDMNNVGGDLPLFCTEENNMEENENDREEIKKVYYYVVEYPRTLKENVEKAYQNRKRLLDYQLERNGSVLQICPYMKNFLTAQWRSTLRTHFAKLNCAYPEINVTFTSPQDVEEKLKTLLDFQDDKIVFGDTPWYEAWFDAFKDKLTDVKKKKVKYKGMKKSLVVDRFERIRKHQRKNVPYNFLRRRAELIQCI